jgi:hypothetical protein
MVQVKSQDKALHPGSQGRKPKAEGESPWNITSAIVTILTLLVAYASGVSAYHWPPYNLLSGRHPSHPSVQKTNPSTRHGTENATRPTPTVGPSAKPTSYTCLKKLQITSPHEGTYIANGQEDNILISGTACDLGTSSGWLFDYDPEDGYYYSDYSGGKPSPVVRPSQAGVWYFNDSPIGAPGDNHKMYTITLVLASPACDKALQAMPEIGGDYKIRGLPLGCYPAAAIDVYVSNS